MPPIISPDGWTLEGLLRQGPRFREVPRCRADDPNLDQRILAFEKDGVPLVIEGWHKSPSWPDIFHIDWLMEHCGDKEVTVRDLADRSDKQLKLRDFISHSRAVKISETEGYQYLYNKDAHCPPEWEQWVASPNVLPEILRPSSRYDLFRYLTHSEMVESLMCYLGVGGTFTPCHKDLCASSGHNLMCYTEQGGSSFWFMTESQAASECARYFGKDIGKELDWEDHTATVDDFAKADFPVYITEQKLGDLVLVPPRSSHQVVNSGGLTVKTSWSRMTTAGLTTALYHELPLYRRVCRAEQYRVKHILYRALTTMTEDLNRSEQELGSPSNSPISARQFIHDQLYVLVQLFDFVLHEEFVGRHNHLRPAALRKRRDKTKVKTDEDAAPVEVTADGNDTSTVPSFTNIACDFCAGDIFQTFFECQSCADQQDDPVGNGIVICSTCYVEGRSCLCEDMNLRQCREFRILLKERNMAVEAWNRTADTGKQLSILTDDCVNGAGKPSLKLGRREAAGLEENQVIASLQWKPSDQASWHELHKEGPLHLQKAQSALHEADKFGLVIADFKFKLVQLAREYKVCRPMNYVNTKAGWYDVDGTPVDSEDDGPLALESDQSDSGTSVRPDPPKRRKSAPVIPSKHEQSSATTLPYQDLSLGSGAIHVLDTSTGQTISAPKDPSISSHSIKRRSPTSEGWSDTAGLHAANQPDDTLPSPGMSSSPSAAPGPTYLPASTSMQDLGMTPAQVAQLKQYSRELERYRVSNAALRLQVENIQAALSKLQREFGKVEDYRIKLAEMNSQLELHAKTEEELRGMIERLKDENLRQNQRLAAMQVEHEKLEARLNEPVPAIAEEAIKLAREHMPKMFFQEVKAVTEGYLRGRVLNLQIDVGASSSSQLQQSPPDLPLTPESEAASLSSASTSSSESVQFAPTLRLASWSNTGLKEESQLPQGPSNDNASSSQESQSGIRTFSLFEKGMNAIPNPKSEPNARHNAQSAPRTASAAQSISQSRPQSHPSPAEANYPSGSQYNNSYTNRHNFDPHPRIHHSLPQPPSQQMHGDHFNHHNQSMQHHGYNGPPPQFAPPFPNHPRQQFPNQPFTPPQPNAFGGNQFTGPQHVRRGYGRSGGQGFHGGGQSFHGGGQGSNGGGQGFNRTGPP
ncbi:hypothetical protein EIP91_003980 [Steccherinum ochraceum]|uniref:JmjC domain-containing protein n=1 Tax=Steccherinum ochraceum TaxID=92696 RepID=A0A4R0RAY3_9APHY|nr:hypothetical protein EIP91_003980 [Steccherinum ochraceum]